MSATQSRSGAAALNSKDADQRTIAIMGDGGFWHNGLTSGVGNAVFNKNDQLLVVVDNNYAADNGRVFTESEVEHRAPVAVIGADHVENLFPHVNPVGKSISIGGKPFTVIGTAEPRGKFLGMSMDEIATCNRFACEASFIPEKTKKGIWEKYFS